MSLDLGDVLYAFAGSAELLGVRPLFWRTIRADVDSCTPNDRTPIFIVPDLHIVSDQRATGWRDDDEDLFHLGRSQHDLLVRLLARLIALRDDPNRSEFAPLAVYQMGDFHDLWREAQHWWGEDIRAMVDRQFDSHQELFALFGALKAERLVGNHDDKLRRPKQLAKLADQRISNYFPVERIHIGPRALSIPWGYGRVDLFHGDEIDRIETGFLSFLNPLGARMAMGARALGLVNEDDWKHELLPAGFPDPEKSGDPIPDEVIDPDRHSANEEAEERRKKFYTESRRFILNPSRIDEATRDRPCLAAIIGHTHAPCIVADAAGEHILVDCGGWVNRAVPAPRHPGETFWNSQIGVLVGNQVAVLQIEAR